MKKFIAVAVLGLLISTTANATGQVGQCVYPKTKMAANGNLEFKNPVYISSAPNAADVRLLKSLSAFTVKAERNGYIQLATVPDYQKPDPEAEAGKIVGWAKLSDFKLLDFRNCE